MTNSPLCSLPTRCRRLSAENVLQNVLHRATNHPQRWFFCVISGISVSKVKCPQTRINKGKTGECSIHASLRFFSSEAGLPGFEPCTLFQKTQHLRAFQRQLYNFVLQNVLQNQIKRCPARIRDTALSIRRTATAIRSVTA